ncbi:hypothetical protein BGX38DRAFT_1333209 [Terfezia claveryi]|nr:hypothetical protein BGX38DRAFT_1333209 [Terfezia claveryi]
MLLGILLLALLAQGIYSAPLQHQNISNSATDSEWNGLPHTQPTDNRVNRWVDGPNTRGTLDIVWSSLFTIFICTYTMLCLNVPAMDERLWRFMGRKIFWMGIAIAGPEFVLTIASGQWGTARESVILFQNSGFPEWTLRHGFFADMGGVFVVPRVENEQYDRPFPVTSKQLNWLVTNKYLPFPDIREEDIVDKSKQDTIAKIVTSFQVGYLILQCIGRILQKLAITTLELFTLAIVACSILTCICWLQKPLDVRTPIRLTLNASIGEIRKDRLLDAEDWKHTPLDFVDDLGPTWNFNVQKYMGMPLPPYHERPVSRFGNDRFPNLKGPQEIYLCCATLGYAAIHLAGWNWTFPTRVELILWRVSSVFLFGTTVLFWVFETTAAWHRRGWWALLSHYCFSNQTKRAELEGARLEKQSSSKKTKVLPLPAEFWSILPLAVLYGAARGYLVVEVFMGLRSLEPSAYAVVNWTSFLPHV